MAYKLGIIPAAGKSTRFGSILKELLPLPNGQSFLREAVSRLECCDDIVLVTNRAKIQAHEAELGGRVIYIVQDGDNDILSAIKSALRLKADYYLFTMPDTYLDRITFHNYKYSHFGMGLFQTNNPERFGCLVDGKIINKQPSVLTPCQAWGVMAWSYMIADFWAAWDFIDYTEAINEAIRVAGLETWKIENYHDNASVNDYGRLWR